MAWDDLNPEEWGVWRLLFCCAVGVLKWMLVSVTGSYKPLMFHQVIFHISQGVINKNKSSARRGVVRYMYANGSTGLYSLIWVLIEYWKCLCHRIKGFDETFECGIMKNTHWWKNRSLLQFTGDDDDDDDDNGNSSGSSDPPPGPCLSGQIWPVGWNFQCLSQKHFLSAFFFLFFFQVFALSLTSH